jgi:hypothetical protein
MVIMNWKTDNEGRLVAAWKESRGSRTTIPCTCFVDTTPKPNPISPASRPGFFSSSRSSAAKAAWIFIAKFLLLFRLAGVSDCALGKLNLNLNPRKGSPYLNIPLFAPKELGTPGTCWRRFFYGPGRTTST